MTITMLLSGTVCRP